MSSDLAVTPTPGIIAAGGGFLLPATIADHGDKASERFFTFFCYRVP